MDRLRAAGRGLRKVYRSSTPATQCLPAGERGSSCRLARLATSSLTLNAMTSRPLVARLRRSRRHGPADGLAPRRRRPRDDALRHRTRPRARSVAATLAGAHVGAHAGRARGAQRHRRHHGAERRRRAVAGRRRSRPAARPDARRAAARHLVVGALAHRGDRARLLAATPASPWSTRRSRAPSGARRRPSSSSCAAAPTPTSSACGRCSTHGQGGLPSRPARRRPCDEVPEQPRHRDQLPRRQRRPGDRQALRPRSGGDGRRARPLDRHVVDLADAHPPARASAAASTIRSSSR